MWMYCTNEAIKLMQKLEMHQ